MSIYHLSATTAAAQTQTLSLNLIHDCDTRLRERPHHPVIWTERAQRFLNLNYPELAASDAFKATLLCDEDLRPNKPDARRKLLQDTYNVLYQALIDCHCEAEALDVSEKAWEKTDNAVFKERAEYLRKVLQHKKILVKSAGGTPQEQEDRMRDGGICTVEYPWLDNRHYTRSPELVTLINEELKRTAGGKGEPSCYVTNSTLLPSSTSMLGIFAARTFQPNECILTDRTATGICSNPTPSSCSNCHVQLPSSPTKAHCCDTCFCSPECRDLALTTYHAVLCGQDFSWFTDPARDLTHNASPLRPLLMLRFLAICVQAGPEKHPLDHPLIARLQAQTENRHVDVFTLKHSVDIPIRILLQLGVDVWTNRNFDTMVLHTIWTRLANNKAGEPDPRLGFVDEITPHLPLFNHSCEPNVQWEREQGSTTVRFFAKRRVEMGEELFCSYLGEGVGGMGVEERWEALGPWFEGMCLCGRCKREQSAVSKA